MNIRVALGVAIVAVGAAVAPFGWWVARIYYYVGLILVVAGALLAVGAHRRRKLDFEPTEDQIASVVGGEARGFKGREIFGLSGPSDTTEASDD